MSRVKIDVPGWGSFNGEMRGIPFENGVSTRELTPHEKLMLGSVIGISDIDSGKQVGAGVEMANIYNVSAEVKPVEKPKAVVEDKPVVLEYDRDRLEEIASEGGIKAVREIAAKFNVKGVEISKMIDGIIEAQKAK